MTCQYCSDVCVDDRSNIPQCAFLEETFSKTNWNCGLLNKIRYLALDADVELALIYDDADNSLLAIPLPEGGFIILTWYKQRGTVDSAQVVMHGLIMSCTLEHAQKALKQLMGG